MRKNDAFDVKIVNSRLTKIFMAIFATDERLPSSATLAVLEIFGVLLLYHVCKSSAVWLEIIARTEEY